MAQVHPEPPAQSCLGLLHAWEYPAARGFDSSLGFMGGSVDYVTQVPAGDRLGVRVRVVRVRVRVRARMRVRVRVRIS